MARLFSTGFELQSVSVELDGSSGTGISIDTTTKRSGTAALKVLREGTAGTSYTYKQYAGAGGVNKTFARFYLRIATAPSADTSIFEITSYNSQETFCGIKLNTDRVLQLFI